jgi:putative flippase GtrA
MSSKSLREGSAYVAVAGLSAASDWSLFTAISWLFPHIDVVFAQGPARLMGGVVAFGLHRLWSFKDQEGQGLGTEAGRFMALYIFSFCVSIGTVYVLVDLFGVNRYGSKAFADILCFIVNFFVMKFYVFADARNLSDAAVKLRQAQTSAKSS